MTTLPTLLTVSCPTCAQVEVDITTAMLISQLDTGESWIAVCCPTCGQRFTNHTRREDNLLLLVLGIQDCQTHAPKERLMNTAPVSPLTFADLVDGRSYLERVGDTRELESR